VTVSRETNTDLPSPLAREGGAQQVRDCHTREGGCPVIAGANEKFEQLGVLDHPLSRMMTGEIDALPGNDEQL